MAPKRRSEMQTSGKTLKPSAKKVKKDNDEQEAQKAKSSISTTKCVVSDSEPTYWLIKSEPESRFENGIDMKFSFDDLKLSPDQTGCWDGVRNYQARNFLRDKMKVGHSAFFYHSNCKEPGIVGICQVIKDGYPDHTQFDTKNPHYDSSSQKDNPKWYMVDVKYVRPLRRFISLAELKRMSQEHSKSGGPLQKMSLFTRSRLSVQPVSKEEWDFILQLEDKEK